MVWDAIYANDTWRGGSGPGSKEETTREYRQLVEEFIQLNQISYVMDIGCGDGYLASLMNWGPAEYHGVDASSLAVGIARQNNPVMAQRFICVEVGIDSLLVQPEPRLCARALAIVKDVLQHLPYAKIDALLNALRNFTYILITNDIPVDQTTDIEEGEWRPIDIRSRGYSAVALKEFSSSPHRKRILLMTQPNDQADARQQVASHEGEASLTTTPSGAVPQESALSNLSSCAARIGRLPNTSVIPKTLHQTWKEARITAPFKQEWSDSWRHLNPGWTYRLWTDEDLRQFVRTCYPRFLPVYDAYDATIKRVDAARYLILRHFGGVFVDLDFLCLKPIDSLVANKRLIFGCQYPGPWIQSVGHVCNAWMASSPMHPFWDGIEFDLAAHSMMGVLKGTGPKFLTQRANNSHFFLDPKDYPTVLGNHQLYPFPWHDKRKMSCRELSPQALSTLFPDAYAVTFWTASWWDESSRPTASC